MSGKLRRYIFLENVKDVFKVLKGIFDVCKVLKKEKFDLLFLKGGFVFVFVVIVVKLLNILIIIYEFDLILGLVNKIVFKFVKKIYIIFEEMLNYLFKEKVDFIGVIIWEDLKNGNVYNGY